MNIKFYQFIFICLLVVVPSSCNSQSTSSMDSQKFRLVGGPCEGCEAVLEHPMRIYSTDTLPDFEQAKDKIKVQGTVYLQDGKTPASGVVIYVHHTNNKGIYPTRGGEKGWAKRHGYLRTWVKTDTNGRYSFYTFVPAAYPSRTEPAHIHFTILEPNGTYYWIGSSHFAGDPLLTKNETDTLAPRGGSSGLLDLKQEGSLRTGTRDIILGKNIPNYE